MHITDYLPSNNEHLMSGMRRFPLQLLALKLSCLPPGNGQDMIEPIMAKIVRHFNEAKLDTRFVPWKVKQLANTTVYAINNLQCPPDIAGAVGNFLVALYTAHGLSIFRYVDTPDFARNLAQLMPEKDNGLVTVGKNCYNLQRMMIVVAGLHPVSNITAAEAVVVRHMTLDR